ncbi:MAG: M3 family metallopeptidase [Cyclobacteriaceae bacterium]|nr:M3 family metallopeptidase [Cyclobacteriaceae bacterium]
MRTLTFTLIIITLMSSCSQNPERQTVVAEDNPLLNSWDTPFGVPPYHLIKNKHYLPAFEKAMEEHNQEIKAIIENKDQPSFENVAEALEKSGAMLDKIANVFYPVNSAHTNDSLKEVASTVAPKLSAHSDEILLNPALFDKVKAVYEQKEALNLEGEELRLLEETYKRFVRAGAALDETSRTRLKDINQRLAELSEKFGQNLLDETNDFEYHITDEADLGNLPSNLLATAKKEAEKRNKTEGWVFTLQRPSINPFLQYSPSREGRKILFDGYAMRANNGNDKDNKALLSEMANLRVERANLLGHTTHAHYVLEENMAENPGKVYEFIDQIWRPALEVAKKERADMQQLMNDDGVEGQLTGPDWRFYTEKVRKARYDFDEEALRPYFEVNAVRDGVFEVCRRLFGLTFHELADAPRWHPDQQVFEVKEADGSHLGVVYMDFFMRESKRGGAWMNSIREQSNRDEFITPIVTNNFNFPPPTDDTPSLLSLSEASTLFHEFGHALHGLFSNVKYQLFEGTSVPRDFVEFPSQVMENWMAEPEVLRLFAKHYQTGEVIPDEFIEKMSASGKFNQGFTTVEYLAASYLDLAWHSLEAPMNGDVNAFEQTAMDKIGLIEEIIPRYRSTYFAHIFSGGYSSGYYSYIWSEVLDADAFNAFKEAGLFDQELAGRYRKMLSMGGSVPGMELYRTFRGREPQIDPLLEKRGLTGE